MSNEQSIAIIFNGNSAEFRITTDEPAHYITALIGIEAKLHRITGLDEHDIRALCVEAKANSLVKPLGEEEIIDETELVDIEELKPIPEV